MLKPVAPATEKRLRIGQAASRLGVEPYVLRFWEEEFPQAAPARTPKGQRYYTEEHLRMLERIKHLLYVEKLTIKGARQKLEASKARREPLALIRRELEEIRRMLREKP
ncbi:MAG: MerR family transcriptional regulator [Desulfovibrionales bacterium]|nr:MerR family transcriptional regulator [Desulfovibrionales bacterium]